MLVNRFALIAGSLMAAFSVMLGAFGAHGIADHVSPSRLSTWGTGATYLMYHALGLLLIGALSSALKDPLKLPSYLLFTGSCVFCAALFLLVILDTSWLGAIAPIGGLLMIIGWLVLAIKLYSLTRKE